MSSIYTPWFLATLAVMLIPSCNPKINRFDVTPDRLCGKDTARVSYDVAGTPTVTKRQSGTGNPDSIVYVLFVERHGEIVSASHLVLHWSSSPEKDMVFDTQKWGTDSLIASDTIDVSTFGKETTVNLVVSHSVRPILLSHADKDAIVEANSSSDAFQGLPPEGAWVARASLLPDEQMGDPATLRLHIHIILTCPH
jgi:hypothetical protein